jgi:transcriptional regulator with XRE-family HTH domain
MQNENLYTMKQPELGKRILELRKSKGFTQEELVEKCNINVRTIQRIEAGEVSPRNFTIRTILEALGVDVDSFFRTSIHEQETRLLTKEKSNQLAVSWIGGVFFTILALVGVVYETMFLYEAPFDGEAIYWSVYGVLVLVSLFFFLRGYKILGDFWNHKILVAATYVYFVSEFLFIATTILFTAFDFNSSFAELATGLPILIVIGIGEVLMGIGILGLKKHTDSFAQVIGIFKIVNGAMLLTVILSIVAVFLVFPVLMMEIVFLYIANQKLSKSNHS